MGVYTPPVPEGEVHRGKKGEVTGKITGVKSSAGPTPAPDYEAAEPRPGRGPEEQLDLERQEKIRVYRAELKAQVESKQRAKYEARLQEKAMGGAQTGLQLEPVRQQQARPGQPGEMGQEQQLSQEELQQKQRELEMEMEMERQRAMERDRQAAGGESGQGPGADPRPGREEMKGRGPPEDPREYQPERQPIDEPRYDPRAEPEAPMQMPERSREGNDL